MNVLRKAPFTTKLISTMFEQIDTPALVMTWSLAPWDEAVCGFPVIQITNIQVFGPDAGTDILRFEQMRDAIGAGLVSSRLPHDSLKESMLLEEHGFRFIEMLYAPELDVTKFKADANAGLLPVSCTILCNFTISCTSCYTSTIDNYTKLGCRSRYCSYRL